MYRYIYTYIYIYIYKYIYIYIEREREKYVALCSVFDKIYSAMPTFYGITFFSFGIRFIQKPTSDDKSIDTFCHKNSSKTNGIFGVRIAKKRCAVIKLSKYQRCGTKNCALPKVLKHSAIYVYLYDIVYIVCPFLPKNKHCMHFKNGKNPPKMYLMEEKRPPKFFWGKGLFFLR